MNVLKTLGATATGLMDQMSPVAEKMKEGADELFDKLGTESRHVGEMLVERFGEQMDQLPDATLKRLNLVTARKARRRTFWAMVIGLVVGAVLMKALSRKTERGFSDVGRTEPWNEARTPAPVTGEVPR